MEQARRFPERSSTWARWPGYGLVARPYKGKSELSPAPVRLIVPEYGGEPEYYSPLDVERRVWLKGKRQPAKPGGGEPPHVALANLKLSTPQEQRRMHKTAQKQVENGVPLDLVDALSDDRERDEEDAILAFVSKWGLLGLENIPHWRRWHPIWQPPADPLHSMRTTPSRWFRVRVRLPVEDLETGETASQLVMRPCEPLDAFRQAALEFQEAAALLTDPLSTSNVNEFTWRAMTYLQGMTAYPYLDGGTGGVTMTWNIRSLLDALYFRLMLDLAEKGSPGLRHCKRIGCGRLFLPRYVDDVYCSAACRKSNTIANQPNRVLARELMELEKAGKITGDERRRGRAAIARLWGEGKGSSQRSELSLRRALVQLGVPLPDDNGRKEN